MKQTWRLTRSPHHNHPILVPDDADAIEYSQSAKEGQLFVIDLKVNRSPQQHKLYFALLKFVVDQSDQYTSVDQLLTSLKIATGRVKTIIGYDGKTYFVPDSISFASMDGIKFRRFFEASIDLICEKFVPTLENESLRKEFWGYLND
ncbi:MAG: DUF1367 family protein [Hyphomicrobiales bacterium]